MDWFGRLCRNTGLMVYHAASPFKKAKGPEPRRHECRRTVEQHVAGPGMTLRRTTIDEIEIHPETGCDAAGRQNDRK